MRAQTLAFLLFFSCLLSGCSGTEAVPEDAIGCTYSDATNFNDSAVLDDGSCVYAEPPEPTLGCMYSSALNYNPSATDDDGSCRYPEIPDPVLGCTYSDAFNFDANATKDDGSCVYDSDGDGIVDDFEEGGCTNPSANNHNMNATDDDGSCDYDLDDDGVQDWAEIIGCTDTNATSFDPVATDSNNSLCEYPIVMTLEMVQNLLDGDIEDSGLLDRMFSGNESYMVRLWDVTDADSQDEGIESESNANTTGLDFILGHDPVTRTMYQGFSIRFLGDISMEQTTVQSPEGINYRIGNSHSGSWYFARDEVYDYDNPFNDGDDDESDLFDEEEEDTSSCNPIPETNQLSNWSVSSSDGTHIISASNESWSMEMKISDYPLELKKIELWEIGTMVRCGFEVLDPSDFHLQIDTDLPRTSMTLVFENEFEEESGDSKTWSGDVSAEHFEEVNLEEIRIIVGYMDGGDEDGEFTQVSGLRLSDQSFTNNDQCFRWTISWSDNDNDGLVSTDDSYTVTRNEKFPNPCSEEDEYRNNEFIVSFYDDWAEMPTGGVFTPGFGFFVAILALINALLITRRK